jgi:hypothetical protein
LQGVFAELNSSTSRGKYKSSLVKNLLIPVLPNQPEGNTKTIA